MCADNVDIQKFELHFDDGQLFGFLYAEFNAEGPYRLHLVTRILPEDNESQLFFPEMEGLELWRPRFNPNVGPNEEWITYFRWGGWVGREESEGMRSVRQEIIDSIPMVVSVGTWCDGMEEKRGNPLTELGHDGSRDIPAGLEMENVFRRVLWETNRGFNALATSWALQEYAHPDEPDTEAVVQNPFDEYWG